MNQLGNIPCEHADVERWPCNGVASRLLINLDARDTRVVCVAHAREYQRTESGMWVMFTPTKAYAFKK